MPSPCCTYTSFLGSRGGERYDRGGVYGTLGPCVCLDQVTRVLCPCFPCDRSRCRPGLWCYFRRCRPSHCLWCCPSCCLRCCPRHLLRFRSVTSFGAAPVTAYGAAAPVTAYSAAAPVTYGAAPVTAVSAAPVTAYGAAPVTYGASSVTRYGGFGPRFIR